MITPLIKKSLVKKSPVLNGLLVKGGSSGGWRGKPADWSDIRNDCPANSIALYAGELGSNYIIEDGKLTWANPNVYLESTGNNYIDTELVIDSNYSIDCLVDQTDDSKFMYAFGTRYTNEQSFILATQYEQAGQWFYRFGNASSVVNPSITHIGKHFLHLENDSWTIDNKTGTFAQNTFTAGNSLYLFSANHPSYITSRSFIGKAYYFKIYNGDTLVAHFVPVPSGLVIGDFTCPSDGMFDIVNQQFYGNLGTGTFTYGKDSISNDYDNLGFTATCTGGYNVFIDGTQYGSTYASGATCNITWSTSGITTGDYITTPSALKAHKIWISPATEGDNITIFRCKRVAASGTEQQGILWAHFNIDNQLSSIPAFGDESNQFRNTLLTSITAKDNKLRVSNLYYAFYYCNSLEYIPELVLPSSFSYYLSAAFAHTNIKKITLKDTILTNVRQSFQNCQKLKKIIFKNIDLSQLTNAIQFITNATSLEDTVLDLSSSTGLTVVGCYGNSSYFMSGFKGLRVSNQAPFSVATPPQINVSYTGMDRQALVTLFNDLPTVSDGQIINITACAGSEDLTASEVQIANDKGWTVAGGPEFTTYYAYTNNANSLYTTDDPIDGGTFNLENSTVVGVLTNNNGIYSGFGTSNYLQSNFVPDLTKPFTFIMKFKQNSTRSYNWLFATTGSEHKGFACFINSSNKLFLSCGNASGNSWQIDKAGVSVLSNNQDYWLKYTFDGTSTHNVYLSTTGEFNGEETTEFTKTDGSGIYSASSLLLGHNYYWNGNFYFDGSIDMLNTSITIDGVTTNFGTFVDSSILYDDTFTALNPQPEFTIMQKGLQNAKVEGALTNNNGVYSGFSSSNYFLTNNNFNPQSSNWEIIIKFKTSNDISTQQAIIGGGGAYSKIILEVYNGHFRLRISSNNSFFNVLENFGTYDVQTNTDYIIRCRYNNTTGYTMEYKTLNSSYQTDISTSDTTAIYDSSTPISLGANKYSGGDVNVPFYGSVDMKETSITIDGQTTIFYNSKAGIIIQNLIYERNPSDDRIV